MNSYFGLFFFNLVTDSDCKAQDGQGQETHPWEEGYVSCQGHGRQGQIHRGDNWNFLNICSWQVLGGEDKAVLVAFGSSSEWKLSQIKS